MSAWCVRGDARRLPLPHASVDLIVTSPPYWSLRSYRDNDEHYAGQIGSEETSTEWLDVMLDCTREWARVLKPSGSIWVNLGDSYSGKPPGPQGQTGQRVDRASAGEPYRATKWGTSRNGEEARWTVSAATWLAGVIDCEGSISVRAFKTNNGTTSFVAWMRVGMMDPQVCARIREITGVGRLFQDNRGVYNWSVASQQARYVLERIWPYLLIKQRQALGAIELCRHVEDRRARGKWSPLTDDDIAYRLRITEAVRAWNQRGEYDWEPPRLTPIRLASVPPPREKSLRGLPWRYALGCIDQLGLILRAEIIWAKPNGLPESVTDRVRRSHEQWFHFTKQPRYFAAVDYIREQYAPETAARYRTGYGANSIPGSVWSVPTEPLRVPEHLGVDHFAAYPLEWPLRIIKGWSPAGICVACGEGRRPVVDKSYELAQATNNAYKTQGRMGGVVEFERKTMQTTITGEACACTPHTDHPGSGERSPIASGTATTGRHKTHSNIGQFTAVGPWREYHFDQWTPPPTTPAVILDPFGGTGTTALAAKALGRVGISVDLSHDYTRLARWRTTDPRQIAKAMRVEKPPAQIDGQLTLMDLT